MRGCQKRVIYVKNTGSEFFDEAYFVIKRECCDKVRDRSRMIDEANRIIEENFNKKKISLFAKYKWHTLVFFLGATLTLCIMLICKI